MPKAQGDLIMEYIVKTDLLEDRLSRHTERIEASVEKLEKKFETKIDQYQQDRNFILEKIANVERQAIKEIHSAQIKIATISGALASLITLFMAWVKKKFVGD